MHPAHVNLSLMTAVAQPDTPPKRWVADPDPAQREDHFVQLTGASWDDYERILAIRGEHSAPRITYDNGLLQIMSPSRSHEALKSLIGCLIEVFCLERDLVFDTCGSWTLKRKDALKGLEPDECYVFGQVADPEAPDLAIEVIWSSGSMKKLGIYETLGVREVWIWQHNQITVHTLGPSGYEPAAQSAVLAGINLPALTSCIDDATTTSAAIKAFRAICTPQG